MTAKNGIFLPEDRVLSVTMHAALGCENYMLFISVLIVPNKALDLVEDEK